MITLLERKHIEAGTLMIAPYKENNMIVLSGKAENRRRARSLIVGLDKKKRSFKEECCCYSIEKF